MDNDEYCDDPAIDSANIEYLEEDEILVEDGTDDVVVVVEGGEGQIVESEYFVDECVPDTSVATGEYGGPLCVVVKRSLLQRFVFLHLAL